ncbi:DUF998 domain-containing protein [Tessaracoccus rhinocerotis]|nr:DUF998 domain-containing protein [Tessaracoccus rhinocerotis]
MIVGMRALRGRTRSQAPRAMPSDGGSIADVVDRRGRLGAFGVIAAVLAFAVTAAVSLSVTGTTYAWQVNMISDLGDSSCRTRGGRWICSPGFALFNTGLIITGLLLTAAGVGVRRLWGRLLAGSLAVMGVGLVVAGVFPAGDAGALHLAGVVLALVVPGLGLLISGIRPETAWLHPHRVLRGLLGGTALVFCAENRLTHNLLPQGAGELIIVGCLLLALLFEAARILAFRPGAGGRVG